LFHLNDEGASTRISAVPSVASRRMIGSDQRR
jgi:hypothetical protein